VVPWKTKSTLLMGEYILPRPGLATGILTWISFWSFRQGGGWGKIRHRETWGEECRMTIQ
jgi:hypothetical protein